MVKTLPAGGLAWHVPIPTRPVTAARSARTRIISLPVRAILHLLARQGFSIATGIMEPGNLAIHRMVNPVEPKAATRYEHSMIVVSVPLGDWRSAPDCRL